jgi:cell division septal protein FtsQ
METSDRFFRPPDTQATRRNYRRVQVHRVLAVAGNVMVVVCFALALGWLWQTTQRDARFAIREISATGAVNTPQSAIDEVTQRYVGVNLFQLDIEQLKRELLSLPWVAGVAIEKELPGRLAVHVTERVPVAIVSGPRSLRYADAGGDVFADLDPRFGAMDLPLVTEADAKTVPGCIAMLESLRAESPDMYSRISEISPADGGTFRIWDRDLGADVFIGDRPAGKWKTLHAIAAREGLGVGTIDYADLRFEDRVIVRPRNGIVTLHEAEAATETARNGEPSVGSGRPGNA